MEHGQHNNELLFEFPIKQPRLLPYVEPPPAKSKEALPKDYFSLEAVDIEEGMNTTFMSKILNPV